MHRVALAGNLSLVPLVFGSLEACIVLPDLLLHLPLHRIEVAGLVLLVLWIRLLQLLLIRLGPGTSARGYSVLRVGRKVCNYCGIMRGIRPLRLLVLRDAAVSFRLRASVALM